MSHGYVAVHWNRRKWVYDACVWAGIAVFVGGFVAAGGARGLSPLTVWMRAFALCGLFMLTLILCIGPLARIDRRFLPLLYNRRHFGVSLFVVALLHGALAVYWYHSFGVVNPVVSVFTSGGALPFQALGAAALALLFLLAATSHDYWNATLGASLWKALHMLIYPAYALVIAHTALGALQDGGSGLPPAMVAASVLVVGGLHLIAGFSRLKGAAVDNPHPNSDGWVDAGRWCDIPNNRARIISVGGAERIAVFRYDRTQLAAVSNVCRHQAGPLGEGRVIDGLITCPWHGYQYRPEDGCSPPPFAEKIATYRLKVAGERLLINPVPLPPGAPRPVVEIAESASQSPPSTDDG